MTRAEYSLESQTTQLIHMGTYVDNRSETNKEVPAKSQLSDLGAHISNGLLVAMGSARRVDTHIIDKNQLQLTQLGLLLPDFVEANLFCDLAGDDVLTWLCRDLAGILVLESLEEGPGLLGRSRWPDEGSCSGGIGQA